MLAERVSQSVPHRGRKWFLLRRHFLLDCAGETILEAERLVRAIGVKSELVECEWYRESFATADRIYGLGAGWDVKGHFNEAPLQQL